MSGGRPTSLNDFVDPVNQQLCLATFKEAVAKVRSYGPEARMSKWDARAAFRRTEHLDKSAQLSPTVVNLLAHDVAPNSKTGYVASYNRFTKWARNSPVTTTTMINYAGHLYDQVPKLAYTTIRGYIDGVRHEIAVKTGTDVLKAQRAPELDLRYKMVMRAIRRQRSGPRLVRTAVTLGMMRQMTEHPDDWFATKNVSARTIKAAQCIAFFALTRMGRLRRPSLCLTLRAT
jgi:hypothetical protein